MKKSSQTQENKQNPKEATIKVLKLKALKKEIENNIGELEDYLMSQMTSLGVNSFPFDFAKATIITTTKTQVTDERKVIEKLREIGLYDEYVEPRLRDIFPIKEIVKEHGVIDGIVQYESEPYIRVTATKQDAL